MNKNEEFDLPSNALVIMVGLAGSGKSTLAKRIAKKNTIIVSTDDIHEEFYGKMIGESDDFQNGDEIFEEFYKRIEEGINEEKQVIADATSVSYFKRKALYEIALKYSVPIRVIVMNVPLKQVLKQNKQREKNVPEEKIQASFEKLKYGNVKKDENGEALKDKFGKTQRHPNEYIKIGREIEKIKSEGVDAKVCDVFIIPTKDKHENER